MKLFPDKGEGPRASLRRRQWGQAMAEFALVLSALLLIIFLVIEAAAVIQGYLAVEHAAREAVRWAITYQPIQGQRMDSLPCTNIYKDPPFIVPPYTPERLNPEFEEGPGLDCDPTEDTDEYNARRVALIKEIAFQRAAGLRINWNALGLTESDFQAHFEDPGFFGVRVWGFPAFDEEEQLDHPGLPGLPVRVQVVHNVQIMDPLFRAIAPYVRVEAHAEMINEGVQVGYGNVPPPTFNPPPTFVRTAEGELSTDTQEPGGSPSPSPPSVNYQVEIAFDFAENVLPIQRGHNVTVTVTDENGTPMPDVLTSFSTDFGAYDYSGVSPQYVELTTDGSGQAIPAVYANRPGTANLTAWIDLDGDDYHDPGEPYDTAEKRWMTSGPYIVASNHEVFPLDTIAVSLYDHPPAQNPFSLLWCRTSITGGIQSEILETNLYVDDATGAITDLPEQIPEGSLGSYRLESHAGMGTCGNEATLVAYSADIHVLPARPDLTILSFNLPDNIQPQTVFTMSVVVANLSAGRVDEPVDVDFFVDPDGVPAEGRIGVVKQWIPSIEPYGTAVLTVTMWVESVGAHEIWARVDTTGYVEETDEDNNVGMTTFTAECPLEEHNGQVVIPATQFSDNQPGIYYVNNSSRQKFWELSSYGGVPTMLASENQGDGYYRWNHPTNPPTNAPVLRYTVNFETPGTYYIWARGQGPSSHDDSFWVSLDGAPTSNCYRLTGWGAGGLTWESQIHQPPSGCPGINNQPALVVSTPGQHTVEVRMREDGFQWATIVLTTTAGGPGPSGDGPQVICGAGDPPPWGGDGDGDGEMPPGMIECTQLLHYGGFEGNPQTIFSYWQAGGSGAYQRTGYLQYEGAFSMRLHASLGDYPCQQNSYAPYLYQTVQIPTDVISLTHLTVSGQRAVAGSLAPCSYANSPDADDVLYVEVRDGAGQPLPGTTSIGDGGATSEMWEPFNVDFTSNIDLPSLAGQQVQIYFYATHDQDFYGTFFYLDDLECNLCTYWPVPDPEPGTASIGGLVRTLVGGVPEPQVGVDVWAYSRGGEVYHTRSIHDGTYHFYNLPPGTYTIYSEAWVGGSLRTATTVVTVVADERNYGVHLLLL